MLGFVVVLVVERHLEDQPRNFKPWVASKSQRSPDADPTDADSQNIEFSTILFSRYSSNELNRLGYVNVNGFVFIFFNVIHSIGHFIRNTCRFMQLSNHVDQYIKSFR